MECLKLITVRHGSVVHKVPCGKCAFCLTNKRSAWMFRISHEMRLQEHPGYFLTLTYDEKHVKRVPGKGLSLRFRDVQLFLKKIRKFKFYAKYICVGEYGAQTHRPHYHLIIWTDCPPDRLQQLWWSGQIHFGALSVASAMYTLKYIIQPKQRDVDGIERTRAQFSKGLGLGYLTSSVYDYHTFDYDDPVMMAIIDGRKVALPRYYKTKIFTKWQMRQEAYKSQWRSRELHCEELSRLLLQGMRPKEAMAYMLALRQDQATRIISTTKFNQHL